MYLPFWFSFVNFINAGIWIAYSVIYKIDVYVLVSAFIFFGKISLLIDFPYEILVFVTFFCFLGLCMGQVVNVVGALTCAIHLIILCCSAVRCLLLPKRIVPSSSVPVVWSFCITTICFYICTVVFFFFFSISLVSSKIWLVLCIIRMKQSSWPQTLKNYILYIDSSP